MVRNINHISIFKKSVGLERLIYRLCYDFEVIFYEKETLKEQKSRSVMIRIFCKEEKLIFIRKLLVFEKVIDRLFMKKD